MYCAKQEKITNFVNFVGILYLMLQVGIIVFESYVIENVMEISPVRNLLG